MQAFLFSPNNTGTSSLHCFVHSLIHNVSFVYFINQKASKQNKCSCGLEVGQEGCFCYLEPFVITSLVIASYKLLWCEDNQFNSTENDKENGFHFTVHCALWGDGRKSMYPGEADRAWSFL